MHTVLSRPQPLGSAPPSHHVPRKSASFLSLRQKKEQTPTHQDPHAASQDPSRSKSYFDAYPRPKSAHARSHQFRGREPPPTPPSPPAADDVSYSDHTLREKKRIAGESSSYQDLASVFPSTDAARRAPDRAGSSGKPKPRLRSRTGPSHKPSEWDDPPGLRFSGSSTQNGETPPDTPVDSFSFPDFHVSVAAPISGVETMDALVDGMNGGDDISFSRSRFGLPGHHPLYQPPLPTPPPGVVLGGGKARKVRKLPRAPPLRSSYSGDEEDESPAPPAPHKRRPRPPRSSSNATITISSAGSSETQASEPFPVSSFPPSPAPLSRRSSRDSFNTLATQERPKSIAPSISDIIRAYAPIEAKARSRVSLHRAPSYAHSHDHATTVQEESEPEPEPLTKEEEAEFLSRSSIDSVADEVQRTLRNQIAMKSLPSPPPPPSSFSKRHSTISDNASLYSPRSDGGSASIYSMSATSSYQPLSPFDSSHLFTSLAKPASPSQAVAQYLRSARLTTLLKLTRSPHASQDNPLTVSLSDLGSSSGIPIVVFLGLGCVRHIMGLYDEMAECLGLRLITIDRWGLGRTEPRSKSAKGIMQWASVVEEVLDLLHIDECSVMAHSAGAPYALSFCNKLHKRIRGDVCLLAPWVGGSENGGYKWLKYVPNGLLKTAQAAEWKLQAWMIGKPPTIAYEGIGFSLEPPSKAPSRSASPPASHGGLNPVYSSGDGSLPPRPSMTSSTFSEYDDLRDFDGRFESRSTLGVELRSGSGRSEKVAKRKNSRGFLDRFKATPSSPPMSSTIAVRPHTAGGKLKALRSMSSLRSKASSTPSKSFEPTSPQLPPALKFDVGLGFDDLSWSKAGGSSQTSLARSGDQFSSPGDYFTTGHSPSRVDRRRSLSFNSPPGPFSLPGSPQETEFSSNASTAPSSDPGNGLTTQDRYQAALANALLSASHSESARGTHNDLLQILNHDNHPWGFSYTSYPHDVKVWYGDKDEKIAENAVRWMERAMGEDRCTVNVVKGADHGLMYKSSVVVEVLEHLLGFWQNE